MGPQHSQKYTFSYKVNSTLKGHTIEVSSLACDCSSDSLLISGSADTSVKLWDLRTKNSVSYVKPHKKRVNAITTTASRVLLSGGDDCLFNAFDLRMMKPLFLNEVEAPVLCIDSSQKSAAVGCMDRLARLYSDSGRLVGSTRSETMPVTCVTFY